MPPGGVHIRLHDWPPTQQEVRLQRHKLPAAVAFARANGLDRVALDGPNRRLGIVTTGKSYLDVRQALDDLGIDDRLAREIGLSRLQGRPLLAAGAGGYPPFRRGPRGTPGGRGEAGGHRDPDQGPALRLARREAPRHRRQARRARRLAAAVRRRTDARRHRPGDRPAHRTLPRVGRGESAPRVPRREGAQPRRLRPRDQAPGVFLLRVPAQHLDPGARRLPGGRRHRLPLHGQLDGPGDGHLHPHGRRRRQLDRHRAVHRTGAHVRQHRRRHLLPFGAARHPRRGRRRRQRHLQDPLTTTRWR